RTVFQEARTAPVTTSSCSISTCQPGEWGSFAIGELAAGESWTVTVPVQRNSPLSGEPLTSHALVTEGSGAYTLGTRPTVIAADEPSLQLAVSSSRQVIGDAESHRYEVDFGNVSAAAFQNLSLSVDLPTGASLDSASDGGTLVDGQVVWDLGTVNAGAGGKRWFTLSPPSGLAQGEVLVSEARLDTGGEALALASESVVVRNGVGLTLDVTTIGDRSQPDDLIYYRYVVANKGVTDLADVTLDMMVSERTVFQEARTAPVTTSSCSISTCQPGEWGSFAIGELAAGESWTVTVPVQRNSPLSGEPLTSHALVTEGSGAYTLGTRHSVIATNEEALQLALIADSFTVESGGDQTVEVWAGNPGANTEENLLLSVVLPDGYAVSSASGTSEVVGNTVYWPLGNLSAGTWRKETLTVTADSGLAEGETLALRGRLNDDSALGSVARAMLTSVVTPTALDYSVSVTPGETPLVSGSDFVMSVTTNNSTGVQYTDVVSFLTVPVDTSAPEGDSGISDCSLTTCQSGEWGSWAIGVLDNGDTDTRSLTGQLASSVVDGQLLVGGTALGHSTPPMRAPALFFALGVGDAFVVDPNHDSDNDGIPDWWEIRHQYDRLDASDAATDDDMDGSQNLEEFQEGTSPTLADTDGDGILDGPDTVLGDEPPVADAGEDRSVTSGAEVTLDGTGSSQNDDPSGSAPLTYSWSQTSGTAVTLSDPSDAQPTFTAPTVTAAEQLEFNLVVSDDTGNSDSDSVVVEVTPEAVDEPPVADAGPDQPSAGEEILPGDTVTLNGSNSSDVPDDLADLTFAWTEVTSTGVTLSDSSDMMPTFTAPDLGASGGTLEFQLTVEDTAGQSDTDSVLINVSAFDPPVADAGPDQEVDAGASVSLDGSNSTDSDGDITGYGWTQTDGEAVSLAGADTPAPSFTAPDVSTMLEFELEVTDSQGLKDTDKTVVNVTKDPVPVCRAGDNQTVDEYASGSLTEVTLDASGSTIVSGSIASYQWSQEAGPGVTLSTPSMVSTLFTVPEVEAAGASLTFKVTCTSDKGVVASDTVTINVVDVNRPPVADAGDDQDDASTGAQVMLNAIGSMDPDGDAVTYQWTQTGGTAVTLSDPSALAPTFIAPDAPDGGVTLTFEVSVSDGDLSDTDEVAVTVFAPSNTVPGADAGLDQTVGSEEVVTLDASASSDAETPFAGLALEWEQVSGPDVTLSSTGASRPTFTAPETGTDAVELVFRVTVTDEGGQSASDEVVITVRASRAVAGDTAESSGGDSGSGGCSVVRGGAPDPTLPLVALAALIMLYRKRLLSLFR
ncbi:REJ domain-containing protein, partial [Tamilnaduibacter salinus]